MLWLQPIAIIRKPLHLKIYTVHMLNMLLNLTLTFEGPCIIFCNIYIYIYSNEIHNVVALIKCLLVLRCQLYMFWTVTVHPQELLCRYCMCRLWYVLIRPAGTTFFLKRCTSWTYQVVRFLPRTIVCIYSIYKEAAEYGPLRSETCRADTCVLINT